MSNGKLEQLFGRNWAYEILRHVTYS